MPFRFVIRSLWRRSSGTPRRRPAALRRTVSPRLLALEDRALPSAFTVANLADAGPGSLRATVLAANAHSGSDDITFAHSLKGTITLNSTLSVTDSLSIDGPGEDRLTVSGHNAVRVFSVSGASTSLALSDLTVADGLANDATFVSPFGFPVTAGGGLVADAAHVTLTDVTFTGNRADGPAAAGGGGAALLFGATLAASDVTWTDNLARGGIIGAGGAIYADAGSAVTVDRARFGGNRAVALAGGDLVNPIPGSGVGGAITIAGGGQGAVARSTFTGNQAQGGNGPGALGGAGGGGAIYVTADSVFVAPAASTFVIAQDTFEDNRALGGNGQSGANGTAGGTGLGGAIRDDGSQLTVAASRFDDNRATGASGGAGEAGGNGGDGGDGRGGAIFSVTNPLTNTLRPTVIVGHSTFMDNEARGGAGGTGGSGGNGGRGGVAAGGGIRFLDGILTLTGSTLADNQAVGGTGGARGTGGHGGAGGDGIGGGVSSTGPDFPAFVVITATSLFGNAARGGAGAAGANGGDGLGGGVHNDDNSTLTLARSSITHNEADGGRAGAGGAAGQGLGGGVYNLGTVVIGPGTRIKDNDASTGADDCFGC